MKKSNSNVSISDIIKSLNNLCDLELNPDDYDGVVCDKLAATNTIKDNSGHQAHIALSGPRMDLFPAIWIYSYQTEEIDSSMKSFLYLKAPVTLYKNNISYYDKNEEEYLKGELREEDFNNKNTISTYMSVKLSHRKQQGLQIELGQTTRDDDDPIKQLRKVPVTSDVLVIAKRKQALKYDLFIIGKKDGDKFPSDIYLPSDIGKFRTMVDTQLSVFGHHNVIEGKNIIYYGAPGTGKSHEVDEEIKKTYEDKSEQEKYVFRVTLHPEYTYTDFVGQLLPYAPSEDKVSYKFEPNIFTLALKKAYENPKKEVYLVLEEMSRANVAAVFGDVFQLLDRTNGVSDYPIDNKDIAKEVYGDPDHKVTIPRNMTIYGTVNTSDQNVFAMDTAFKRRFEWRYISTDKGDNATANPKIDIGNGELFYWVTFYKALNKFIVGDLGLSEDKQIGPFFIKFEDNDSANHVHELIQNKLLQYLWEDVNAAAYNSSKSLFLDKKEIPSFSELYKRFGDGKSIFSESFKERLREEEIEEKHKKDDTNSTSY